MNYYNENDRLKRVVEISTLVTESDNFFEIKDKIVEKNVRCSSSSKSMCKFIL